MKKAKLGRSHGFFPPETFLFILAALLIIRFFGLIYLLFFLLVILCVYVLIHLIETQRREQTKLLKQMKALADARLFFIKKLITLAYETDNTLFHKKFKAAVCIKQLREAGIVVVSHDTLNKRIRRHIDERTENKLLTDNDIELCCLLLYDFSPPELTVIYDLKSIQSSYMKRHRLRNKLETLGLSDVI